MIRLFVHNIKIALARGVLILLAGWLLPGRTLCQQQASGLTAQVQIIQQADTTRVNMLNELSYQYQWYDFHRSLGYAENALKVAEKLSFKKGVAEARYRIAHCYWELGNSELAIEQALQALAIAEHEQFADILAESYKILAINYRDQIENEKAELYISKAEQISIQTKNWDLLSRVYNLSGVIQFTKNRNDSALSLYNRALAITKTHKTSNFHLSQIYSNIGEVYGSSKVNSTLEYAYYRKALTIAKETRNRSAEAAILNNIGKVFMKKKNFEEANNYFHESLRLARMLNLKRVIKNVYLSLVDLSIREGKSRDAYAYVEKYHNLRDSLINEKKTRQIVEMEKRYEAEFLKQEKHMQTIMKDIWIVGSLFLLIFVLTIYRLQQLRARKSRQVLAQQRELNLKLEETDKLKSRFFANISHEFRTPLSLIIAPLEVKLSSTLIPDAEKKDLQLVKRNADRLLDLINQLLDLSKLEAGKMKLRVQRANLDEFLTVLAASFDSLAENNGIQFTKNITVSVVNCWFDVDKLEKIATNILFNAFKFTSRGGAVILSINTAADENDLLIKITDTGKGIAEEDLPHLFSPFYQSKHTVDDGQPGTGLGLSLVGELVKLYHGRIDITSQLNKGTTISISLPINKSKLPDAEEIIGSESLLVARLRKETFPNYDEVSKKPSDDAEEDQDSILIVEDNAELRNFIANGFRNRYTIFTAKDGKEGLTLAIQQIPNLIISDVMMPQLDGLELTDKIRSDERTSHIPIILLTAKADAESRLNGFKTGADDYISKPFSIEELHVRAANLIQLRKNMAAKLREDINTLHNATQEPSIDEKFLHHVRRVIEEHISNTTFGVEELAQEMCLSRTQLFRKVKALLEISPSELINDIRLQKAATLIQSNADTLAQIGYSVGFNEQSYFAKRFRKKFGVSPGQYNKHLKSGTVDGEFAEP